MEGSAAEADTETAGGVAAAAAAAVETGGGCGVGDGQSNVYFSGFVWDEESKLYFHPSTGFYHDPSAGWYYSSHDGLYYTFENGSYVALDCNKGKGTGDHENANFVSNEVSQYRTCGMTQHTTADGSKVQSSPSDWIEDTLIDLYLSGYTNSDTDPGISSTNIEVIKIISSEDQSSLSSDKQSCNTDDQQVENEYLCKHEQGSGQSDPSSEEESWKAQYGQVVQSDEVKKIPFPVVDLWNWEMITEPADSAYPVSRLTGRLVRCPSKLHPSLLVGGGLLKTAAIHKVHLDLVRVSSGKVYRLRTPSTRYLASIPAYDSSNPTQGWDFPDLYANLQNTALDSSSTNLQSDNADTATGNRSSSMLEQLSPETEKHQYVTYRDRAAERRMLHGGFGIGIGQKHTGETIQETISSPEYINPEDAASEAMNMTFGSGSYARKILESMGWKDGQGLGRNSEGILEPLQAVSNKGFMGLGWSKAL